VTSGSRQKRRTGHDALQQIEAGFEPGGQDRGIAAFHPHLDHSAADRLGERTCERDLIKVADFPRLGFALSPSVYDSSSASSGGASALYEVCSQRNYYCQWEHDEKARPPYRSLLSYLYWVNRFSHLPTFHAALPQRNPNCVIPRQ
jgi:hypothetical protein